MSEKYKISRGLLNALVSIRHELVEDGQQSGAIGILLKDEKRKVFSCIFPKHGEYKDGFLWGGCAAAPHISKEAIAKAVAQAYKQKLIPIGIVLLNPDEGDYDGGDDKTYYIGGSSPELAIGYSVYRMSGLIRSFVFPMLMIIIDSREKPLCKVIESEKDVQKMRREYIESGYNAKLKRKPLECVPAERTTEEKGDVRFLLYNKCLMSAVESIVQGGAVCKGVMMK